MEIGISTATFFGKDVTENAFDNLRALNVKVTEVFLNTFFEYKPSFGNMLAERKENIKVHSMHAHTNSFEPELFNDVDLLCVMKMFTGLIFPNLNFSKS